MPGTRFPVPIPVTSTIPQIAPAALARMRRDSGFRPAMSTTEYISVMSLTSTYGAVLPEAIVETMTFGTPTGSVRIAAVIIVVPPPPPRPSTPSKRCLRVPHGQQRRGATLHRVHCRAAVATRSQRREIDAASAGHVVCRDIGSDLWCAEHTEVDQQCAVTTRLDGVADEPVFVALGVERAEQEDGAGRHDRSDLHGSSCDMSTSAGPSKRAGDRMARNTSVSSPAL